MTGHREQIGELANVDPVAMGFSPFPEKTMKDEEPGLWIVKVDGPENLTIDKRLAESTGCLEANTLRINQGTLTQKRSVRSAGRYDKVARKSRI